MIKRIFKSTAHPPVLGHDIDKPRVTAAGWCLIFIYLAIPAMLVGGLVDLLIQLATGQCVGVWCLLF